MFFVVHTHRAVNGSCVMGSPTGLGSTRWIPSRVQHAHFFMKSHQILDRLLWRAVSCLTVGLGLLVLGAMLVPAKAQVQVLDPQRSRLTTLDQLAAASIPCASNDFTIAEMAWPSAAILAHIHMRILTDEFECSVRVVTGDPAATISSMATTRQPAVAPELWVSRHAELWNGALRAQSARAAAPVFSGGALEAWFVPDYVRQNHPGLTSVAGLMDYWQVFESEGEGMASLVSCPQEWACALINRKLVAANRLGSRFDVVEPEDRFALDRLISDAVAQREPVLAYYWQPNALIDRLNLVPLEMGSFDMGNAQCMALADCVPFGTSSFAPDTVVIGVAEWVFTDAPQVAGYFQRATMPLEEMNRLLVWQAEQDATPDAVAAHFVATREAIWRPWLGQVQPEDIDVPADVLP